MVVIQDPMNVLLEGVNSGSIGSVMANHKSRAGEVQAALNAFVAGKDTAKVEAESKTAVAEAARLKLSDDVATAVASGDIAAVAAVIGAGGMGDVDGLRQALKEQIAALQAELDALPPAGLSGVALP